MSAPAGSSMGRLVVHATQTAIDTNTTTQLSASFSGASSSEPPAVHWSIADGQNDASIGQGAISAKGLYTPPPLLSRDDVTIEVKAALTSNPAIAATYLLTVTPGFVQSLTPENASLTPGGTVRVTGEIAEVNSGGIEWSLRSTAGGSGNLGPAYGAIGKTSCHHSVNSYTTCTAVYTAPRSLPAGSPSFYLTGAPVNSPHAVAALHILLNGGGFNTSALENQAAQTGSVAMGSSGGNANDYDSSQDSHGNQYVNDCCGGTLGALVQNRSGDHGGNLYILSNNHVLAESDQGRPGDTIIEPALIDLNCNPQAGRAVGSLRYVVPLKSTQTNVDAALATATPAVDASGAILQLGASEDGTLSAAAPAAGSGEALTAETLNRLKVVKSGRTTGLTCSTVGAVDLTVQVDYYYDCAETQPFYTKTYTNQIGIPGISFADSGDSGALVLDASNAEPIGLLFASGSGNRNNGFSVANPIQDVLSELGTKSQADGQQFQIVGGAQHPIMCSNYDLNRKAAAAAPLSTAQINAARPRVNTAATLMKADSGVFRITMGRSLDRPEEAAVVVYVDKNMPIPAIPKTIDGMRTLVVSTDAAGANAGIEPTPPTEGIHLPADVLRAAEAVVAQYAPKLMSDPAFFGVGVAQSYDNPKEAALLVLVDVKKTPKSMPDVVGGLRVRYATINRLHVTRSRSAAGTRPTSCQLHAMRR